MVAGGRATDGRGADHGQRALVGPAISIHGRRGGGGDCKLAATTLSTRRGVPDPLTRFLRSASWS